MKVMKQFVFYTQSMYTGFGNVGFIHANLIQKPIYKKITVRTLFKRNIYVGSSSNNGSPEKRLNTVLYKQTIFKSVEDALYKNMKRKMN